MTFKVVIPARLASTRLPDKPLADIAGKPMVVRVAERAQASGADEVIVATDVLSILQACEAHGVKAMMTLSSHPSGTDRIAEVAVAKNWADDAVVVNVQGDEPLIDPKLIRDVAAEINRDVPVATAAHRIHAIEDMFNPNMVKVVTDSRGQALYFSRAAIPWNRQTFADSRQPLPAGYPASRHIGIYAFRNAFLKAYPSLSISPIEQLEALEQLRILWHGHAIAVFMTEDAPAAGVDTLEDLQRVRAVFKKQPR